MERLVEQIAAASPAAIARAAQLLRAGRLVGFPTETVYGLGADARDGRAVAAIFAAKGRPRFNPLIVHVADRDEAARHVVFSDLAQSLAETFWPGALTLVLPRRAGSPLSDLVSAGLDTVALRVPAHPVAAALIRQADLPVAAPSANPSGRISATTARHVAEGLGQAVDVILDAGPAPLGLESTVIGFDRGRPVLLRPGAIARADIEAVVGPLGQAGADIRSPGQLQSHYAPPRATAIECAPARRWAKCCWDSVPLPKQRSISAPAVICKRPPPISSPCCAPWTSKHAPIAVMPVPETGLGEAINDRLRRAAAPRNDHE